MTRSSQVVLDVANLHPPPLATPTFPSASPPSRDVHLLRDLRRDDLPVPEHSSCLASGPASINVHMMMQLQECAPGLNPTILEHESRMVSSPTFALSSTIKPVWTRCFHLPLPGPPARAIDQDTKQPLPASPPFLESLCPSDQPKSHSHDMLHLTCTPLADPDHQYQYLQPPFNPLNSRPARCLPS
ncbi:hypothetical protein BC567DRAFT_19962 [Phyllosticta citribraziliensis]